MLSNILAGSAVILSLLTFGLAQRSAQATDRRSRIPVLVFAYDPVRYWFLRNVGNGPALNIVLAVKIKRDDTEWQKPTRIPPIGREGEFDIFWLGDTNPAVIAASYEDFLAADTPDKSREYTVLIEDDINRIFPQRLLPPWDTTQSYPHWQRQPDANLQKSPQLSTAQFPGWRCGYVSATHRFLDHARAVVSRVGLSPTRTVKIGSTNAARQRLPK